MTAQRETRACPFLGLERDAATRYVSPDSQHRCWAASKAQKIESAQQQRFCLTDRYLVCARFAAATLPQPRALPTLAKTADPTRVPRSWVSRVLPFLNIVLVSAAALLLTLIGIALYVAHGVNAAGAP